MSRSRKKTPRCGDNKGMKRYANRVIRRNKLKENINHMQYKRLFNSYEICDYQSVHFTFNEYWRGTLAHYFKIINRTNKVIEEPDIDKVKDEYERFYIRK